MADIRRSRAAQFGPIGLKANIAVAGLRTGNGFGRDGPVAAKDAALVAHLRKAGYSFAAQQPMDEAAFGATGDNPHHGRLDNPAAPGHSPGGSSCGGAVAVAGGMLVGGMGVGGMAAAIGTDTLGSVRIPAAYCGIIGFKPSRGMMPMEGVVPLSPSMDDAGVMARDIAVLAEVVSHFLPTRRRNYPRTILAPEDLGPATPEVQAAFEAAVECLLDAGFNVQRRRIPGWTPETHRRAAVLLIEAEGAAVHRELVDGEDAAMSGAVRTALRFGRDARAAKIVDAVQTLRRTEQAMTRIFDTCDLIAVPTTPSPAYAWAEGPPRDQALFTALANWAGLPAISIPVPVRGRPIGLQLIGGRGRDWSVIQAATSFLAAAAAHWRA